MATAHDIRDDIVVLAQVAPFALGPAIVRPATRELIQGQSRMVLEPRVMQVLVVLAEADGAVVSQQELIMRCWAGRVVGDNAIHRVVSQIRRVIESLSGEGLRLETIKKVGYRLVTEQSSRAPDLVPGLSLVLADERPAEAPASPVEESAPSDDRTPSVRAPRTNASLQSRRALLGAFGATALSAAALTLLWRTREPRRTIDPAAIAFARRGMESIRTGRPLELEQAIASLKEAIRIEPAYAEAWGELALAYSNLSADDPAARYDLHARSAAARALALEPDQPDAQVALIELVPAFGRWSEIEARYARTLERHPDHPILSASYGSFLGEVGRCREGVERLQQVVEKVSFAPLTYYRLINFLWSVGRLEDAEAALEVADRRWPRHSAFWEARFKFLTYTGRAAAAMALLSDPLRRPTDYQSASAPWRLQVALAAQSRRPSDVDAAVRLLSRRIVQEPSSLPGMVQHVSGLGRPSTALAMLAGYFFGTGAWAAAHPKPGTPFATLGTGMLFGPLMEGVRREPGFEALVRAIGLHRYWARSGKSPDYRLP